MKLYVICLDAFPCVEELQDILYPCTYHEHVCASAFTLGTMSSMISGQVGTEMIEGGVGYHTMYMQHFNTWRKKGNIIDKLTKQHEIHIHNNVKWMDCVIMGNKMSADKRYVNPNITHSDISTTEHVTDSDNLTTSTDNVTSTVTSNETETKTNFCIRTSPQKNVLYTSTNPNQTFDNFVNWNDPQLKTEFYENEQKYINWIQSQKFSGMVWIDLCHFHEYVYYKNGQNPIIDPKTNKPFEMTEKDAINDTLSWLKNWNLNEPNSFFYFYADHSHRVQSYLDPPSYLTWLYTKNNTQQQLFLPKIVYSCDFANIVSNLFLNEMSDIVPREIYAMEDNRAKAKTQKKATTYVKGCLNEEYWISVANVTETTLCEEGIYICICRMSNKHTFTCFYFKNDEELKQNIQSNLYKSVFTILCQDSLDQMKKNICYII